MILKKNQILILISSLFIFSFCLINSLSGQKTNPDGVNLIPKKSTLKQDTIGVVKKQVVIIAEPDTNFTWEKYASFLRKISDTSKYIVLPLNEFRQTFNSNKIVIGLRHDVDIDLNVAYQFSQVEYNLGFRSTFFILHTAPYYLANSNNMDIHTDKIIPILKSMQNDKHLEIGWHNDLVTLQVVYNINPVAFLQNELNWLRSNGLHITGTASHGSNYCKTYHYLNYYFFEECTYPVVTTYVNNITVPKDGKFITLMKGKLEDFNLEYEAYFLNNNKAFSDATIVDGIRWNIGMLDLDQLQTGDRVIILLHPIHWHRASVHAKIESFSLIGQLSSSIDTVNSVISVEMPYGISKNSLTAVYTLSSGAYAKVSGKMQVSRITTNYFNSPLVYKVYAENRDIQKEWTVNVHGTKSSACDFKSFSVPGMTQSAQMNTSKKTILVEVDEHADLKHLPVQFSLSPGASAWFGDNVLFSNTGTINFSHDVQIRVLAEDGITSCVWTITVKKVKNLANFISFSVPGLSGRSVIDTLNNTITGEISQGLSRDSLIPSFVLSPDSHAWFGNQEQISNVTYRDFTYPVFYDIVSKDSQIVKNWKVTLLDTSLSANEEKAEQPDFLIYPNPSEGNIHMHFLRVKTSPTAVDIFNTLGEKVYSEIIKKTGDFIFDANLKKLQGGVYIVRYSEAEKPGIILIKKH